MSTGPFPAIAHLQYRAVATHEYLVLANQLDCPTGEETLTDNNLIELMRQQFPNLVIYKARGDDEPTKGFDWEWYIGNDNTGWRRYAVQAKKLNLKTNKYDHLRHPVNGVFQIDVLDDFARSQRSTPLYCFYNAASAAQEQQHWHCNRPFAHKQLGCSLAPLQVIKPIHDTLYIKRTFELIHQDPRALPWHCILCPQHDNTMPDPFAPDGYEPDILPELPAFLRGTDGPIAVIGLPADLYASRLGGRPRHIVVINTNQG
ncbi:MAG TPA: DUF6615 family protein [Bryobacteraceae bacterium]|jgi:hypothetical protein